MRSTFHEALDALTDDLVEMTRLVGSAMMRASTALLDADCDVAESVISADEAVDALYRDLEGRAIELLVRQQPVAADLRRIVTTLRISADLERMGDLARHVAKIARRRFPQSAVPADIRGTVLEMGQVAERMCVKAGSVIAANDIEAARQLERDDDEMDRLHRAVFHHLLGDTWTHGIEPAIDITLVARFYERYADHAVSVARRVVYLVTGEYASTQ